MTGNDPHRSGVRLGPLQAGERVNLSDVKGRRHSIVLEPGGKFFTARGEIRHDQLIGGPDGNTVESSLGQTYLCFRPLLEEFTVSMKRGAAVIYPKDAAMITMFTDVFPGARVLEAGVGSGALTLSLLRAVGPDGVVHSYERREEFAAIAERNVTAFFDGRPENWQLHHGDLAQVITDDEVDRVVLDMLAPWDCIEAVTARLVGGGLLCCYVATTTQLGRVMDTLRATRCYTEPRATETTIRSWHAEGLAIRPGHQTSGHTGFLVIARRMAHGVDAPLRKRRPAPGAYGSDYHGPVPPGVPVEEDDDE